MRNVTGYSSSSTNRVYDEGLRTYMANIFKYMSFALILTTLVSFVIASSPQLVRFIFGNQLISLLFLFAPMIFVFNFTSKIWSISPEKARNYLWIYSGLMGVSLSSLFMAYTGGSLARTFLVSASTFAATALYGNTTKKDLTGMGSFMMMGLFGILIATLLNFFIKSSGIEFATSILGVIIFVGLTAYDVQRLKDTYSYVGVNSDTIEKVAIIGALNLYMDFINLFIYLLRFMGDRKN
ncbi:MAG: Bax inhibitor-1/YccA family protein [Rickettsiales bacterium]|nr:MAG: Bax inhibitor-1/YccA family protein [Rickettsiales bacterium]